MQTGNVDHKDVSDDIFKKITKLIGQFDLVNGPWISGGAARRLWAGEEWIDNDIDIFFKDQEQFNKTDNMLTDLVLNNEGKKISKKSKNANTYIVYRPNISYNNNILIQTVHRTFYKTIIDVWNDFDITVCKFATDGNLLIADKQAAYDFKNKILRLSSPVPMKLDAKRIIKYSIYGYKAQPSIIKDLLLQYQNNEISWNIDNDDY